MRVESISVAFAQAVLNARFDAATDRPQATEPDPDGVLVGGPTRRGNQLFKGLMRISRGSDSTDDEAGTDAANVTLYAIVDEREDASGSGEFVMTHRGRAGHTIDDPDGLSDDTTRILVTVRDRTCRMPGCDRPVEHLHHLIHRTQPGPTDDPGNLVGVCLRCHHHVIHRWRWSGTVGALGRITWHRPKTPASPGTTVATLGRLAGRLPRPPPDPPPLDPSGDPIPF